MFEREKDYKQKQKEDALEAEGRALATAIERIANTIDGRVFFSFVIDAYFSMMRDLNTGNSATYTRLGYYDCFREFFIEPLMAANFTVYASIERELMEKRRV